MQSPSVMRLALLLAGVSLRAKQLSGASPYALSPEARTVVFSVVCRRILGAYAARVPPKGFGMIGVLMQQRYPKFDSTSCPFKAFAELMRMWA